MSQMTLNQLASQMSPEVADAYYRLGEALAHSAHMPSMPGHSIRPCVLLAVYPCGCVGSVKVQTEESLSSATGLDSASPESESAADNPSIPDVNEVLPLTRWGIS